MGLRIMLCGQYGQDRHRRVHNAHRLKVEPACGVRDVEPVHARVSGAMGSEETQSVISAHGVHGA